jgi:hypothetical protein
MCEGVIYLKENTKNKENTNPFLKLSGSFLRERKKEPRSRKKRIACD